MSRSGKAGSNSAAWTSKYGSIIVAALDIGTSEGMNERGLAVHLHYQATGSYEPRDQRPGITMSSRISLPPRRRSRERWEKAWPICELDKYPRGDR